MDESQSFDERWILPVRYVAVSVLIESDCPMVEAVLMALSRHMVGRFDSRLVGV